MKLYRLYDLKGGEKIYADLSDGSKYLFFGHLDGMYSFNKTEKGGVFHLAGATPLVKFKDGYKLKT